MRKLFASSLALAIVSTFGNAGAREAGALRANRIEIEYSTPKTAAHENIYRLMRARKVLERFKEFLSPLRLPRVLLLRVEGCDGEINAWYADDAVTVCYEYLDSILQNAPEQTTPDGVTRMDAVIGPLVDVFLHEVTPYSTMLKCPYSGVRRTPPISLPPTCGCSPTNAMRVISSQA
jgi:hypothetical protein